MRYRCCSIISLALVFSRSWCNVSGARPDQAADATPKVTGLFGNLAGKVKKASPKAAGGRDMSRNFTACVGVDSDRCLEATGEKGQEHLKCRESADKCDKYKKDMHRCCSQTCNVDAVCTKAECDALDGRGKCVYPNDAIMITQHKEETQTASISEGVLVGFPKADGLFNVAMTSNRAQLHEQIGSMDSAMRDLAGQAQETDNSMGKYRASVADTFKQINMDKNLPEKVSMDQYRDSDKDRMSVFESIPWKNFSWDGNDIDALDWNTASRREKGRDERTDPSLIQMKSSGSLVASRHQVASRDPEPPWAAIDKKDLIASAAKLLPEDDREEAEKRWASLSDDHLRDWFPKYFHHKREEEMGTYKDAFKRSDDMDNAGLNLATHAAEATKALVNAHRNLQEWKHMVSSSVINLDKLESLGDGIRKAVFHDLQDENMLRIKPIDGFVTETWQDKFDVAPEALKGLESRPEVVKGLDSRMERSESDAAVPGSLLSSKTTDQAADPFFGEADDEE